MADTTVPATDQASGPVTVNTTIEPDRTVITVNGTKDMAVVVVSDSGERIYLPPEETDDDDGEGPYQPADQADNPYDGMRDDGPYASNRQSDASVGLNETASGFRIVHAEPATDLRVVR